MAFTIQGQIKAAAAITSNFDVNGLILFKLCMKVAYWCPGKTCYMAFARGTGASAGVPEGPGGAS